MKLFVFCFRLSLLTSREASEGGVVNEYDEEVEEGAVEGVRCGKRKSSEGTHLPGERTAVARHSAGRRVLIA